MLDPKVAENARLAWENFVLEVSRMESRMLTAMAETIDKQWADMVAETPKERHDAATCCSGKQVGPAPAADGTDWPTSGGGPTMSDVGEGWRELGPDEVTKKGDEVKNIWGCWQAVEGVFLGRSGSRLLHRRRVTPVPPAPQSRPAETRASSRQYVNEDNMKLRTENATLTAEVERLRLTREEAELLGWMQTICSQQGLPDCAARIASIADRLGGGE